MKKIVLLIMLLLFSNVCFAEEKVVTVTGTCIMGDSSDESVEEAQKKAKEDALKKATEKVCVFVESFSETKNNILTKDEVNILSSLVLEVISESTEMVPVNEHIEFRSTVTARVNSDNIEKILKDETELNKLKERGKDLEKAAKRFTSPSANTMTSDYYEGHYKISKEAKQKLEELDKTKSKNRKKQLLKEVIDLEPDCLLFYAEIINLFKQDNQKQLMEDYCDKAIVSIRRNYTPDEIKKLVNNWYIKDGKRCGTFDEVMFYIFLQKGELNGIKPRKVKTFGAKGEVIFKVITKTNWKI